MLGLRMQEMGLGFWAWGQRARDQHAGTRFVLTPFSDCVEVHTAGEPYWAGRQSGMRCRVLGLGTSCSGAECKAM